MAGRMQGTVLTHHSQSPVADGLLQTDRTRALRRTYYLPRQNQSRE